MATGQCSPHPSSGKLLSAANEVSYRKPQPVTEQSDGAQSQWIHLQNNPCTQGSGSTTVEGVRRLKSQRVGRFFISIYTESYKGYSAKQAMVGGSALNKTFIQFPLRLREHHRRRGGSMYEWKDRAKGWACSPLDSAGAL